MDFFRQKSSIIYSSSLSLKELFLSELPFYTDNDHSLTKNSCDSGIYSEPRLLARTSTPIQDNSEYDFETDLFTFGNNLNDSESLPSPIEGSLDESWYSQKIQFDFSGSIGIGGIDEDVQENGNIIDTPRPVTRSMISTIMPVDYNSTDIISLEPNSSNTICPVNFISGNSLCNQEASEGAANPSTVTSSNHIDERD